MADKTAKKTRNRLSFEEKTKIHLYRTEHPEASYEKIAVNFSELWEKRSINQWCIDINNQYILFRNTLICILVL